MSFIRIVFSQLFPPHYLHHPSKNRHLPALLRWFSRCWNRLNSAALSGGPGLAGRDIHPQKCVWPGTRLTDRRSIRSSFRAGRKRYPLPKRYFVGTKRHDSQRYCRFRETCQDHHAKSCYSTWSPARIYCFWRRWTHGRRTWFADRTTTYRLLTISLFCYLLPFTLSV